MLRLLTGDSSISARMACKSSVADITGNNRTSTQPKANKHCSEEKPRLRFAGIELRHSR